MAGFDAVGTKHDRIRFTSDPGAPHVPDIRPELPNGPPRWGGIQIVDSSATDNIISFADVDYAQTSNGSIGMENSEALIDDVAFCGHAPADDSHTGILGDHTQLNLPGYVRSGRVPAKLYACVG